MEENISQDIKLDDPLLRLQPPRKVRFKEDELGEFMAQGGRESFEDAPVEGYSPLNAIADYTRIDGLVYNQINHLERIVRRDLFGEWDSDTSFDPIQMLVNDDSQEANTDPTMLMDAQSVGEYEFLKGKIRERNLAQQRLQENATFSDHVFGWMGSMAQDPFNAVPIFGAMNAYSKGMAVNKYANIALSGASVGAQVGGAEAVREAIMQTTQAGRDQREAVFNVAAATFLGTALGSVSAGMRTAHQAKMKKLHEKAKEDFVTLAKNEDLEEAAEFVKTAESTVGAAQNKGILERLDDYKLVDMETFEKILDKLPRVMRSTYGRINSSQAPLTKEVGISMMGEFLTRNMHLRNMQSPIGTWTEKSALDKNETILTYTYRKAHAQHIEEMKAKGEKPLNFAEFSEEIGRSQILNRESSTPGVAEAQRVTTEINTDYFDLLTARSLENDAPLVDLPESARGEYKMPYYYKTDKIAREINLQHGGPDAFTNADGSPTFLGFLEQDLIRGFKNGELELKRIQEEELGPAREVVKDLNKKVRKLKSDLDKQVKEKKRWQAKLNLGRKDDGTALTADDIEYIKKRVAYREGKINEYKMSLKNLESKAKVAKGEKQKIDADIDKKQRRQNVVKYLDEDDFSEVRDITLTLGQNMASKGAKFSYDLEGAVSAGGYRISRRGSEKARVLPVKDNPEKYIDYLQTDALGIMRKYLQSVNGDIPTYRRFGSLEFENAKFNGKNIKQKLKKEYEELRVIRQKELDDALESGDKKAAKKARHALKRLNTDELNRDVEMLERMFERMRGIDPDNMRNYNKPMRVIERSIQDLTFSAWMGGMLPTSITDIAKQQHILGSKYGFTKEMSRLVKQALNDPNMLRDMSRQDALRSGAMLDIYQLTTARAQRFADDMLMEPSNKFEKGTRGLADFTGKWSLIGYWNSFVRIVGVNGINSKLFDEALLGDWSKLSQDKRSFYLRNGFSQDMANRLKKSGAFTREKETNRVLVDWDKLDKFDKKTSQDYEFFIRKVLDQINIRPGLEVHEFFDTPFVRLMFMFQRFIFSSNVRTTAQIIQRRDRGSLLFFTTSTTLGALSYVLKELGKGTPPSEIDISPTKLAMEGWDRGAAFPMTSWTNTIMSNWTGGRINVANLTDTDLSRRRYDPNLASALGPAASYTQKALETLGTAMSGDGAKALKQGLSLTPAATLIPLSTTLNIFYEANK